MAASRGNAASYGMFPKFDEGNHRIASGNQDWVPNAQNQTASSELSHPSSINSGMSGAAGAAGSGALSSSNDADDMLLSEAIFLQGDVADFESLLAGPAVAGEDWQCGPYPSERGQSTLPVDGFIGSFAEDFGQVSSESERDPAGLASVSTGPASSPEMSSSFPVYVADEADGKPRQSGASHAFASDASRSQEVVAASEGPSVWQVYEHGLQPHPPDSPAASLPALQEASPSMEPGGDQGSPSQQPAGIDATYAPPVTAQPSASPGFGEFSTLLFSPDPIQGASGPAEPLAPDAATWAAAPSIPPVPGSVRAAEAAAPLPGTFLADEDLASAMQSPGVSLFETWGSTPGIDYQGQVTGQAAGKQALGGAGFTGMGTQVGDREAQAESLPMRMGPSQLQRDAMSGFMWENAFASSQGPSGVRDVGGLSQPALVPGPDGVSSSPSTSRGQSPAAVSGTSGTSWQTKGVLQSPSTSVSSDPGCQPLVIAPCPDGCQCAACQMALFDWLAPDQLQLVPASSRLASSPPRKLHRQLPSPLGARREATGASHSFEGGSSRESSAPFPLEDDVPGSWGGDSGAPGSAREVSSSALVPRSSGGSRLPLASRGGSLALPLGWSAGKLEAFGHTQQRSIVPVARSSGGGRADMTGRLADVIKQIKHRHVDSEWPEKVAGEDKVQQEAAEFPGSMLGDEAQLPLVPRKAARGPISIVVSEEVSSALNKGTQSSLNKLVGQSEPGLPGAGASQKRPAGPVRRRPSRAKPAADGTMRPKADRGPQSPGDAAGQQFVPRAPGVPEPTMALLRSEVSMVEVQEQLVALAEAVAAREEGQMKRLTRLLQMEANDRGAPPQRLAFYFLDALKARADGTGAEKYNMGMTISHQEMSESMSNVFSVLPHVDFMHLSAMGTFLEHIRDPPGGQPWKRVHVLALGIWMGAQWVHFLRQLALMPGGPPHLHVTGIDVSCDNEVTTSKASAVLTGQSLSKVAAQFGVPFSFSGFPVTMTSFKPLMIERQDGEGLFVTINFGAMFFPDESVVRWNPRDTCLRWVRDLRPVVTVIAELDSDFNTNFFLPRFREAVKWFGGVFESLETALPRTSTHRYNCEHCYFARDVMNVVACEGLARTVRAERLENWQKRMERLGFLRMPLSEKVLESVRGRVDGAGVKLRNALLAPVSRPVRLGGSCGASLRLPGARPPDAAAGFLGQAAALIAPPQLGEFSAQEIQSEIRALEDLLGLDSGSPGPGPQAVSAGQGLAAQDSPMGSPGGGGGGVQPNRPNLKGALSGLGLPSDPDEMLAMMRKFAPGMDQSSLLGLLGAGAAGAGLGGGAPSLKAALSGFARENGAGAASGGAAGSGAGVESAGRGEGSAAVPSGDQFTETLAQQVMAKMIRTYGNGQVCLEQAATTFLTWQLEKEGGLRPAGPPEPSVASADSKKRPREASPAASDSQSGCSGGSSEASEKDAVPFRVVEYGGGCRLMWKDLSVLATSAWRSYA